MRPVAYVLTLSTADRSRLFCVCTDKATAAAVLDGFARIRDVHMAVEEAPLLGPLLSGGGEAATQEVMQAVRRAIALGGALGEEA